MLICCHLHSLCLFFTSNLKILILGRVALVAQRPIVVKLSRRRSVGPYVRTYVRASVDLSSALWKNGGSDPDAVQVGLVQG